MLDAATTLTLYQYTDLLARSLAEGIRTEDHTADEVMVLHLIDQGVNRPSQLADTLEKAHPTISHILARFQEQNLIVSLRDAQDGRGRVLSLTELGHARLVFAMGNMTPVSHGAQLVTKLRRAATGK